MEIKNYIKKRIDGLVYVDYEELAMDLLEKVNELEAKIKNLESAQVFGMGGIEF